MNKYDYIAKAYNEISLVIAKNKEFIPNSWIPDLEYFMHRRELFLERLSKEPDIISERNKEGNIVLINDGSFQYKNADVDEEYVKYLMNKNHIKTIEALETSEISWNKLSLNLKIIEDFIEYGYDKNIREIMNSKDYSLQLKTNIFDARIHIVDSLNLLNRVMEKDNEKNINLLNCLAVNKDFLNTLLIDKEYELLDENELIDDIREDLYKDYKDDDFTIVFKDNKEHLLSQLSNAGQYYKETKNGRFYLPIIQLEDKPISFIEAANLLENIEVIITTEKEDITIPLGDILEVDINKSIDRYGFYKGNEYEDLEENDREMI